MRLINFVFQVTFLMSLIIIDNQQGEDPVSLKLWSED